jgi:hypothetical protein
MDHKLPQNPAGVKQYLPESMDMATQVVRFKRTMFALVTTRHIKTVTALITIGTREKRVDLGRHA